MCSLILQSEPTEYVPLANAPSSPLLYDMQSTSRQSPPSKTAKYSQEAKQLKVGDYKINKRRTPLLYLRQAETCLYVREREQEVKFSK